MQPAPLQCSLGTLAHAFQAPLMMYLGEYTHIHTLFMSAWQRVAHGLRNVPPQPYEYASRRDKLGTVPTGQSR